MSARVRGEFMDEKMSRREEGSLINREVAVSKMNRFLAAGLSKVTGNIEDSRSSSCICNHYF